MKLEMTKRDKKLLIMLSVFVIVVCIGYWGVYPLIKDIVDINDQIETEEATKQEYEMKLAELPMLEADKEKWEEEIKTARESFFPMMDSAEIDKYFTEMALTYQLESYDLTIAISEDETELSPYQYSERAALLAAQEEAGDTSESESGAAAEQSQIEEAEEAGGMSADETAQLFTEDVTTGIYEATVTMKLGGDEENLLQLIEDLSASDKKLKLSSYAWSEQRSITDVADNGAYTMEAERVLTITVQVYMYQEELSETEAQTDEVSGEETTDGAAQ